MSKDIFSKFNTSKHSLKVLIWSISFIFLGLIGFVVWSEFNYKKGAPLRNGISALKGEDYSLAFKEFLPLAKNGDPLAQKLLGDMYAFGGGVPVDEIKAEIWFRRADTNCLSKYNKSRCLTGQNEYNVSQCYLHGCYGKKKDLLVAKRWLIRSAEAGHLEAQQILTDSSKLAKHNMKIDPKILTYWKDYISSDKMNALYVQ